MTNLLDYSRKVSLAVIVIAATIFIPYGLYKIFPHFVPFILAYFTALLLEPVFNWLEKVLKLKKKTVAIIITYLAFMAVVALLTFLIIYKLYGQFLSVLDVVQSNGPGIQVWILDIINQIQVYIGNLPPQVYDVVMNWVNDLSQINFVGMIGSWTIDISTAIPNIFFLSIIYFVSVALFCSQLGNIHRFFFSFFKDTSKLKVVYVLSELRNATFGFLKAQVILSIITYIVSFSGLMILHVKYAAIMAFLIVLVDILPILGTGSILVPWAVVSLFMDNIFLAVGILVLYIIIIVVRKAIEPKILGERIGLSALATVVTIWVGFKVMGLLGVFLFPLAFIFYKALVKVGVIKFNFKI